MIRGTAIALPSLERLCDHPRLALRNCHVRGFQISYTRIDYRRVLTAVVFGSFSSVDLQNTAVRAMVAIAARELFQVVRTVLSAIANCAAAILKHYTDQQLF